MPRGTGKSGKPNENQSGLARYVSPEGNQRGMRANGNGGDFASISADVFAGVVVSVTRSGGAIMFGRSRDGYSVSVGLYFNGGKNTLYWPTTQEGMENLNQWLIDLYDDLNNVPDDAK